MKYLFLDFDGVLHHTNIQSIQFENLPILAEGLKDYIEQFRIVISSSWREHHTYEFLIHIFPFNLRKIIVGITPYRHDGMSPSGRYKEIKDYCQTHSIEDSQWMAFDDMAVLFPEHCPNLIKTNPYTGITEKEILKFIQFLG